MNIKGNIDKIREGLELASSTFHTIVCNRLSMDGVVLWSKLGYNAVNRALSYLDEEGKDDEYGDGDEDEDKSSVQSQKGKRRCDIHEELYDAFVAFAKENNVEGIDFSDGVNGILNSISAENIKRFTLWIYDRVDRGEDNG